MRHPLLISIGVRLLGIFAVSLVWVNGYMEKRALKADGPRLVINEVAWAGTAASSNDEWIELYNASDMPVDLTGWQLRAADGTPSISLHGVLSPGGFLLLERTDDDTVRDVPADLIYSGALNNQGEQLWLLDNQGQVVDSANADGGGWPAGSSGPEFRTMERIDPTMPDRDDNWASNDGLHRWGVDANGQPINGTPRGPNSIAGALPTPSTQTPTPTPTETATLSPSPTATPSPSPTATTPVTPQPTSTETAMPPIIPGTVRLNELLPAPRSVDWDGDGTATAEDEWIELYNLGEEAVLLEGWQLDDIPDGGSRPYTIPAGTILPAHGYLLLFRRDTKIALNNDADEVRLLAPDGTLTDAFMYEKPQFDVSFSRSADGTGPWVTDYPPSPGQPNQPATPTSTPSPTTTPELLPTETATTTLTPTATATQTPPSRDLTPSPTFTPTATEPLLPTETAMPTPTPSPTSTLEPSPTETTIMVTPTATETTLPIATPTPTGTATPTATPTNIPDVVRLNELLPAPRSVDWDGDGTATAEDEWIELYNLGEEAVLLEGWQLDDIPDGGSRPYTIPAGTILPAHGYLLLFRRDTKIALNNDADEVRLLAPDGTLRDRFAYLHTRPDTSFARTMDGIGGWTDAYPPSPGQPNRAPTPTPAPSPVLKTVFLNEILPAPRERDWDGDGAKTTEDEWIELINLGETMVDLGGWVLDDVPDGGSKPYVFPVGSFVPARGYRLVFRRESKVALNNNADQVRLLSPDGQEVDRFEWSRSPGYDRALGRQPDGTGEWVSGLIPSPGGPNPPRMTPRQRRGSDEPTPRLQLRATHTATPWVHITPTSTVTISLPPLMTIAQVRRQSDGQEVRVRGQVTVPPEVFGRSIYIQDSSGGIQVYMSRSEWPALRVGDWIEVQGRLVDFHGEREVRIFSSAQLRVIGPGAPPVPVLLRGDQLGEMYEGMLVMVVGRVSGFGRQELRLSDHYGEVRVYVREAVGWRRPWVERGDWWSAIGVVSQYAIQKPYVGGYRLLPRYRDDLAPLPMYLPEIGLTSPAEDSPR
jgi:uncharacterized protein YdeI (BOF family)